MRLTCPNCEAQYEVPDNVIPAAGRDVQCSNCGSTWFQESAAAPHSDDPLPLSLTAEESSPVQSTPVEDVSPSENTETHSADRESAHAETDTDDVDLDGTDWDLTPDEAWPQTRSYDVQNDDSFEDDAIDDHATSEEQQGQRDVFKAVEAKDTDLLARRRGLDDSVADILREEAALESQARAAETPQTLETQEELALPEVSAELHNPVDEETPQFQGQDNKHEHMAEVSKDKSARRDLLPDIEEINSTLRNSEKPKRKADQSKKPETTMRRSRGFRLGFVSALLVAAALVFLYSSHDKLSEQYPTIAPVVESFIVSTNTARIWLDEQLTAFLLVLNETKN